MPANGRWDLIRGSKVKPCALEIVTSVFGAPSTENLATVQLSHNAVERLTRDVTADT